jgi:hypothetical protein
MRDKEIVGLYQAYLDVYSNSNEEVEQLDEDVQGAVKGALEKGANIMKTNPVLKAVGSIIAPVNSGRKTPTATSGGYRKEEVEELDEVSDELVGKAVNARIAATGAANKREMEDRTPENMRDSVRAGEKEASMKSAAANRKKRRMNKEEVENWVNSLIDEGYDLSEYTWDDMYEMYVTEGPNYDRNRQRAAQRAAARNAARKEGKTGNVPGVGYVSSRPERETYRDSAGVERHTSGAKMPKKEDQKESFDPFDAILEHLVAEGYADTNESALAIMANMSEEWRQDIMEISQKTATRAFAKRATDEFETDSDNPRDFTKSGKSKADETKRRVDRKFGKKAGEHADRAAHAGIFGRKSSLMPKKPT